MHHTRDFHPYASLVSAMATSSTDKRIDDLSGRVGRVEDRLERFEARVDARFDRMDARFDRNDDRFPTKEEVAKNEQVTVARLDKIDARLDRWGRVMTAGVLSIAGTIIYKLLGF